VSTSLLDPHASAAIRDVVEECANQPAGTDTVFEVMDDLQELVGCDWVMFTVFDTQGRRLHHAQRVDWGERELASPEELEAEDHEPFWRWYWHCEPAALPDRIEAPVVLALSEFYTARQWAQHPMFRDWKRITDPATDELLVSYPDAPGLTRRLVFGREGGKRFDERERFLMKLLRPHVGPLLARTATPPERPDVALTDRQREVLRLVRLGMANKQIARAMKISAGTVRKHLENIYERLGVQSRTEAVHEAALDDQRPRIGRSRPGDRCRS
jgi:DNA-binding CsgD family transcriptional regulator